MNDFDALAARFEQIANGIERAVDRTVTDVVNQTVFYLAADTPIDVGTARSNWAVSVGTPFVGTTRPAFSPYLSRWKGPNPPTKAGGRKSERANVFPTVSLARKKSKRETTDQSVYITNHLPYIGRLNEGYSGQTSANFVSRAVSKANAFGAKKVVEHLRKEFR